jgi:hypothetical protein
VTRRPRLTRAKGAWLGAICSLGLALAATGSPALAGSSLTSKIAPRGFGTPSQIPWASVGRGWMLTNWAPAAAPSAHYKVLYLVLSNQAGQRYIVMKESGPLARADLLDWSGDAQRALFDIETNSGVTTLYVVDLRTGAVANTFVVPTSATDNFQTAGFTRPQGLAIVVDTYTTHAILTRYSLGGQAEAVYPTAFSSVGRANGSWLYSPEGTELVLGAVHGLAFVSNGGTPLAQLPLKGSSYCTPQRWWSATVVLATCSVGAHSETRLFEFHVGEQSPDALTRVNVPPDDGDLSGWRVSGRVYVQVASACGYVYLARLVGAAPIMVNVPGVPSGHSVYVLGASNTALALETSIACQGHPVIGWYTPQSNSIRIVFGPHVTGGQLGISLVFRSPLG